MRVVVLINQQQKVQLNGTIGKNTKNNAVYQNINASLFDQAKTIGEPNLIIDSNEVKAGHSLHVVVFLNQFFFIYKRKAYHIIKQFA